jgi:predicted ribosomally synthesized peptide with SipW-like signal peptide
MKKLGLIILVVVMALGALGAAYAYWSQPLYVNGSVTAGTVAAQFYGANVVVSDAATNANSGTTVGYSMFKSANDVMTITVANAYPGMIVTVPFQVKNTGTLPETISLTSQAWLSGDATFEANLVVTTTVSGAMIAVNGYSVLGTDSIVLTLPADAPNSIMGTSCSFQVVLTANQYN